MATTSADEIRAAADAVRPYTRVAGWAIAIGTPEAALVARTAPISGPGLANLLTSGAPGALNLARLINHAAEAVTEQPTPTP